MLLVCWEVLLACCIRRNLKEFLLFMGQCHVLIALSGSHLHQKNNNFLKALKFRSRGGGAGDKQRKHIPPMPENQTPVKKLMVKALKCMMIKK